MLVICLQFYKAVICCEKPNIELNSICMSEWKLPALLMVGEPQTN